MFKHKFTISAQTTAIVALIEVFLLLLVWMYDEYLAGLVTIILTAIPLGTLIVALLSELVERSDISRTYFLLIGILCIVPPIIFLLYKVLISISA